MYTPVNGGPHLVEIIKTFETRHPACRVLVTDTGLSCDPFDWLREDDLDLLAMRLPLSEPDVTIGAILSREPRILAVAVDHPLATKASIGVEDLSDYTLSEVPTLPRGLMEGFLPPRTPSGRRLRRTVVESVREAIMRAANGELAVGGSGLVSLGQALGGGLAVE
jgi:DNA-binding transcriptional LysR family regulator